MTTRETCILTFNTVNDTTRSVSVPNPVAELDAETVLTAAFHVILANPFDETVGDLTGLARAERVTTVTTVLF